MPKSNELIKPAELAEQEGVSLTLIRRLMKEGELKYLEHSPRNRQIFFSSWQAYVARNTKGYDR